MTYRTFLLPLFALIAAIALTACIEDGISTSPSHQPQFSADTLHMGPFFTGEPNPTYRLMVYNRHDKILNISRISFSDPSQRIFRINVDGQAGTSFDNIEIRPNDSIFVLVESTLPVNGSWGAERVTETLEFLTNGVISRVVMAADGEDIERCRGQVILSDTRWESDCPRQIYDSLVVAPGATLTVAAGARLYFHDKAFMRVEGTLVTEGTPESPVDFCGDRRGNVVADISFDLMASQWDGIYFSPTSRDNRLSHTMVRNTVSGVVADTVSGPAPERPVLTLVNCRLRNSAGYALASLGSSVDATGCEFADASSGVMLLDGGSHRFVNCTFANYYLFTALGGPAIQLHSVKADEGGADLDAGQTALEPMKAVFANCIVYGNGADLYPSDLTDTEVRFRRCLFKSSGEDDDNFIESVWGEDPLYYTERSEYIFDYRVRPDSPAIGAADPEWLPVQADFYGVAREGATLGAYEFVAPAE